MTSEEIYTKQNQISEKVQGATTVEQANLYVRAGMVSFLAEIAAQLAELNENIKAQGERGQ